jgi:hypothetical protein
MSDRPCPLVSACKGSNKLDVLYPEGADMLDLKDRVSAISCLSLWKFVEGDPAG